MVKNLVSSYCSPTQPDYLPVESYCSPTQPFSSLKQSYCSPTQVYYSADYVPTQSYCSPTELYCSAYYAPTQPFPPSETLSSSSQKQSEDGKTSLCDRVQKLFIEDQTQKSPDQSSSDQSYISNFEDLSLSKKSSSLASLEDLLLRTKIESSDDVDDFVEDYLNTPLFPEITYRVRKRGRTPEQQVQEDLEKSIRKDQEDRTKKELLAKCTQALKMRLGPSKFRKEVAKITPYSVHKLQQYIQICSIGHGPELLIQKRIPKSKDPVLQKKREEQLKIIQSFRRLTTKEFERNERMKERDRKNDIIELFHSMMVSPEECGVYPEALTAREMEKEWKYFVEDIFE